MNDQTVFCGNKGYFPSEPSTYLNPVVIESSSSDIELDWIA